jgi:hypothetical protein
MYACMHVFFISEIVDFSARTGPKVIKLRLETSLKSQASDWLKRRPLRYLRFETGNWLVAISANQMLEICNWFQISDL